MNWILSVFLIASGPSLELIEMDGGDRLVVLDETMQILGLVGGEEILSVQEFDFDGSEDDVVADSDLL